MHIFRNEQEAIDILVREDQGFCGPLPKMDIWVLAPSPLVQQISTRCGIPFASALVYQLDI